MTLMRKMAGAMEWVEAGVYAEPVPGLPGVWHTFFGYYYVSGRGLSAFAVPFAPSPSRCGTLSQLPTRWLLG